MEVSEEIEYEGLSSNAGLGVSSVADFSRLMTLTSVSLGEHACGSIGELKNAYIFEGNDFGNIFMFRPVSPNTLRCIR